MTQYVSIITTSYNYAAYLADAIESVINQTYPYWELLIVDDGSTDNSLFIIKAYIKKDSRIRLIQHADGKNYGLPTTVHLGIQHAQYDYIAFLESDDMWTPDSLQERLVLLHATQADVVFNQCKPIGNVMSVSRDVHGYLSLIHETMSKLTPPFSLFRYYVSTVNLIPTFSCVLVKKTPLLQCTFTPPRSSWLDYWLWSQLSIRSTFAYSPKILTLWRIHEKSYNTQNDHLFEKCWTPFYLAVCWNMTKQAFTTHPYRLYTYAIPFFYMVKTWSIQFVSPYVAWLKLILQRFKKRYSM